MIKDVGVEKGSSMSTLVRVRVQKSAVRPDSEHVVFDEHARRTADHDGREHL